MRSATKVFFAYIAWISFHRGMDYVTGNSIDRGLLYGDQLALPVMWGTACLVLSTLCVIAVWRNCPQLGRWAAVLGFAVYTMFAVQVFSPHMLPIPWPPEDTRFLSDHIGVAGMCFAFAWLISRRMKINGKVRVALEADRKAHE